MKITKHKIQILKYQILNHEVEPRGLKKRYMENKKFEPQDFIDDLNRIRLYKDNRVLIWYCNLYIEHFTKLIYKKFKNNFEFGNCEICKKSLYPSFNSIVDELSNANLIDVSNEHNKLIKMIYSSRNTAGHELNFKEIKVAEKIMETLSKAKIQDPEDIISKGLKNITTWENLELAAVAVVAKLHENYEKMNNRELKDKLIFKINIENFKIHPEIVSVNDPNYL